MKIKKLATSLILASFYLLPAIAIAQTTGGTIPQIDLPLIGGGTFRGFVVNLINLVIGITGLVAVAFLIYGGFRYITSAGNDEVAEGAKKTIQNAIIGLIVVILSYTIVIVISRALESGRV